MKFNPVGWFEIYVQDMPRAKAFYENVFQTKLEKLESPEHEMWASLEMWAFPMNEGAYGAMGTLAKMDGVPSGGNSTIVYFSCDDCAEQVKKAVSSGGKVFRDKFSIGAHGFCALVFDTEGNLIGLHSMK